MIHVALLALLATMALALIRATRGPTVFDRILAANHFGTKTVAMIAVLGFLVGEPENYIDIALMYVVLGFIGTVAVLRYIERDDGDEETAADQERQP
jgi:multicomponent Na+:H+ antiporter subunit F